MTMMTAGSTAADRAFDDAPAGPAPGGRISVGLESVSKVYGDVRALDEVTWAFPRGAFTAVMGPSGEGPS